jgi:hypothetical protein
MGLWPAMEAGDADRRVGSLLKTAGASTHQDPRIIQLRKSSRTPSQTSLAFSELRPRCSLALWNDVGL